MLASDIPAKFNKPFGANAGPSFIRPIPENSQVSIEAGAASLETGFPPACFTDPSAGGTPPFGSDFNGILFESTSWDQWFQSGGAVPYDAAFQSAINGYPINAVLKALAPGYYWRNVTDGNTTNPETGGAGWVSFSVDGITTGAMQSRLAPDVLPGWLLLNGLTVGNAASGATGYAAADALNVFSYIWRSFPNTDCPVLPGGRGANPAADFAANKTIGTPPMQGSGVIGADGMGGGLTNFLNGVPVVSGNANTPGSILGENLHSLVTAENATHSHGVNDPTHAHSLNGSTVAFTGVGWNASGNQFGPVASPTFNAATGISIQNSGSGTGHNTVQRSRTVYWYMKI